MLVVSAVDTSLLAPDESNPFQTLITMFKILPFLVKPGSWPQNTAASVLSKKWSLQTEPQALFTHIWIVPCRESSSELSEKSINLTSPVLQSANSVVVSTHHKFVS